MANGELCSEQHVTRLVHRFYAKVRDDALLGPIFNVQVADWDHHLSRMVDFWSSALRGTARCSGAPMKKHVALPKLSSDMFDRWLKMFRETTDSLGNEPMRARANAQARRIAQSLWYGYQMHRTPDCLPAALPLG